MVGRGGGKERIEKERVGGKGYFFFLIPSRIPVVSRPLRGQKKLYFLLVSFSSDTRANQDVNTILASLPEPFLKEVADPAPVPGRHSFLSL